MTNVITAGSAAANSADDVSRILSAVLLADGDLDAPELHALDTLQLDRLLGISRARFRATLNDVCRELLNDGRTGQGFSMLYPERISAVMQILRSSDAPLHFSATLIDLMHDTDPLQLEQKLLDPALLDAALDRVVDPELRRLTCAMLLHLAYADGELHRNEIAVLNHVMQRWNISLDALDAALRRQRLA